MITSFDPEQFYLDLQTTQNRVFLIENENQIDSLNSEHQILKIQVENSLKILEKIKFEDFPKIFLIFIENVEESDENLKKMNEKLKSREIFIVFKGKIFIKGEEIQEENDNNSENFSKIVFAVNSYLKLKNSTKFDFFTKICFEENFKMSRFLLNDLLENFNEENLNFPPEFLKILNDRKFDYLLFIVREGLINLFILIMNLLKNEGVQNYCDTLEYHGLEIFSAIKNEENFQKLLDELLKDEEIYGKLIKSHHFLQKVCIFAHPEYLEKFFIRLSKEENFKEILKEAKILFETVSKAKKISSIEIVWKTLEENLDEKEFFEILCEKNYYYGGILIQSYVNSEETFEFVKGKVENHLKTDEKIKDFLLISSLIEVDYFNCIMTSGNFKFKKYVEFLLKYLKFEDFALDIQFHGDTLLHSIASESKTSEDLDFFLSLLINNLTDEKIKEYLKAKNSNIALYQCNEVTAKTLYFFYLEIFTEEEIKTFLDNFEISKFLYKFRDFFDVNSEISKFLTEFEYYSNAVFNVAGSPEKVDDFKKLWMEIEGKLENQEIIELLLSKLKYGGDFTNFFRTFTTLDFYQFFWGRIEKFLNRENMRKFLKMDEENYDGILLWTAHFEDEKIFQFTFNEIFCKYFELKEFIYLKNYSNHNFLHFILEGNSSENLKMVLGKLKENLSKKEFEEYLRIENDEEKTPLFYAAKKGENFLKIFLNFTTDEFLKENLAKIDDFNEIFLFKALICEKKVFEEIFAFYKKFFNENEMKIFLTLKNIRNFSNFDQINSENRQIYKKILKSYFKPLISHYFEFTDIVFKKLKIIENFFEQIEQKSNGQEIFEFLLFHNCFNIFHFTVQFGKSTPILETVWKRIKKLLSEEKIKEILLLKDNFGSIAIFSSYLTENENNFKFFFENVYCHYLKFEEFIFDVDRDGDNLIVRLSSDSVAKFLLDHIKKAVKKEDFQRFLLMRNKKNQNVLKDCQVAGVLSEFLIDAVGKEKYEEMVKENEEK